MYKKYNVHEKLIMYLKLLINHLRNVNFLYNKCSNVLKKLNFVFDNVNQAFKKS